MGCLQSLIGRRESQLKEEEEAPKTYSWDTRERVDPKDFTIENLNGESICRKAGSINGQQFIIQNCQDSNIYLYDHVATITIDDCTGCRIFIGPIKQSVFIRNCTGCKMMIACQQFRTRDCQKCDIFLCCTTQPIIEASTGMKFGCFQYNYPGLDDQFRGASMSVYNNNWSNIHDFTPVPGENNFGLLPEDANVEDYIPTPSADVCGDLEIQTGSEHSLVPKTLGTRRQMGNESCLVVFFHDGGSHDRAAHFINEMRSNQPGCALVRSKEITMQQADASRVFGSEKYEMAVQRGEVIGLEYNGDSCCQHCQETLVAITTGTTGLVFVSSNGSMASQNIENFYNFADMQMSV